MSENLEEWRADFRVKAGIESAATEAPAEQADTAETPVEEGQARDEAGRFAAKEAPAEEAVAEVAEAEVEADSSDADLEKYLAKYDGDTDKALRAAVEAQKLIGRQGTELGDIRKELAERFEQLEEKIVAPPQQAPTYSPDDVQQFLDENPGMAPQLAQRAKEIGDNALYARAMDAWAGVDASGAMDYAARIAAWESGNQLREEFAPLLSAAETQQQAQAATQAVEQVAAKHQDFAEVIDTVTDEVLATLHPAIIGDLKTGDVASKAAALETLYYAARGVQAEKQPQAAAAAARTTKEDARQARQEAAVGSATSASPNSRETSSNVDAWREGFQASDAFRKAAGLT